MILLIFCVDVMMMMIVMLAGGNLLISSVNCSMMMLMVVVCVGIRCVLCMVLCCDPGPVDFYPVLLVVVRDRICKRMFCLSMICRL